MQDILPYVENKITLSLTETNLALEEVVYYYAVGGQVDVDFSTEYIANVILTFLRQFLRVFYDFKHSDLDQMTEEYYGGIWCLESEAPFNPKLYLRFDTEYEPPDLLEIINELQYLFTSGNSLEVSLKSLDLVPPHFINVGLIPSADCPLRILYRAGYLSEFQSPETTIKIARDKLVYNFTPQGYGYYSGCLCIYDSAEPHQIIHQTLTPPTDLPPIVPQWQDETDRTLRLSQLLLPVITLDSDSDSDQEQDIDG